MADRIMLIRFSHRPIKISLNLLPPFDLKHIQSYLVGRGKTVLLVDQLISGRVDLLDEVCSFYPDIVVISSTVLQENEVFSFSKHYKAKNPKAIIVITGQGASSECEKYTCNDLFDLVLFGEIEEDFVYLIEKLESGVSLTDLRKYFVDRFNQFGISLVNNLDALSMPIYSDYETKNYGSLYPIITKKKLIWRHILSSRGCPHECVFCTNVIRKTYGTRLRYRSPDNVISEIENFKKQGVNIIGFEDDDFTTSRVHVENICRALIDNNVGIPWIAHARIDEVDESLLLVMKKAGCVLLRFGIESGSDGIIKTMKKTRIPNWSARAKEVFEMTNNLKIATNALFIVGSPGETCEDAQMSIDLAKVLNPDTIQLHFFTCYNDIRFSNKPGTGAAGYHYDNPCLNVSGISNADLKKMFKRFYVEFYLRPVFVVRHLFRYFMFYLSNIRTTKKLLSILFGLVFKKSG